MVGRAQCVDSVQSLVFIDVCMGQRHISDLGCYMERQRGRRVLQDHEYLKSKK
jgi:hypothetical protein